MIEEQKDDKQSENANSAKLPVMGSAVKVKFGLEQQGHIPTIEKMLLEWGRSDYYIWQKIGKEIGWCPLTACSWYLEYVRRNVR